MIVYLARDILPFVMYCVYGEAGSSLLIESTDSMIYVELVIGTVKNPSQNSIIRRHLISRTKSAKVQTVTVI